MTNKRMDAMRKSILGSNRWTSDRAVFDQVVADVLAYLDNHPDPNERALGQMLRYGDADKVIINRSDLEWLNTQLGHLLTACSPEGGAPREAEVIRPWIGQTWIDHIKSKWPIEGSK